MNQNNWKPVPTSPVPIQGQARVLLSTLCRPKRVRALLAAIARESSASILSVHYFSVAVSRPHLSLLHCAIGAKQQLNKWVPQLCEQANLNGR